MILETINSNLENPNQMMEILKILGSVLGGGAVGALITWRVTEYRNKKQNVKYFVSIETLFNPQSINNDITRITFSGATSNYNYENLYIATLSFENIGNKEIENFNVDITLPETIKIIKAEPVTMDRSHKLSITNDLGFENSKSEIDIELKPFNRNDKYEIKLFLTITKETIEMADFKLSTVSPINFVVGNSGYVWNKITKTMEQLPYIP